MPDSLIDKINYIAPFSREQAEVNWGKVFLWQVNTNTLFVLLHNTLVYSVILVSPIYVHTIIFHILLLLYLNLFVPSLSLLRTVMLLSTWTDGPALKSQLWSMGRGELLSICMVIAGFVFMLSRVLLSRHNMKYCLGRGKQCLFLNKVTTWAHWPLPPIALRKVH